MIVKNYKIPVHRKIATTETIKTNIEESYFNIDTSPKNKLDINTSLETIIYSVENKENKINIYSNTLNISITDMFSSDGTPLYFYRRFSLDEVEEMYSFIDTLTEYKLVEELYTVFFNKENKELLTNVNRYCYIGNPVTRSPNVKIRKLKDRFKITVDGLNVSKVKVELDSKYLFQPIVYKNYREIPEFIVNIQNKQYYNYNNSFNILNKKEYNENYETKDPVHIYKSFINNIVEYTTWASNTLFNEKLKTKYYYYLKLNSNNATDLILQTIYKQDASDLLYMFSSETVFENSKININPYTEVENKTPIGENYTLLYNTQVDKKYNRYNDIKFGTDVIKLDLEKSMVDETIYLKNGNTIILQSTPIYSEQTLPSKNIDDLPENFKLNLNNFRLLIETIKNNQKDYVDNKIYTNG